jgi:ribosomal protein S18 acetylase RimI-like enzyme
MRRPALRAAADAERLSVMASVLRPAVAGDYAEVATWLPDAASTLRWAGPRIVFPFDAAQLERQLQVPGGRIYTLHSGGDIVAFGQHWVVEAPSVHLGRLIVAPHHRGKGFGRDLCCQLIAAARKNTGASSITLRVYKDNEAALALYLSLGFKQQAEESDGQVLFMRRDEL